MKINYNKLNKFLLTCLCVAAATAFFVVAALGATALAGAVGAMIEFKRTALIVIALIGVFAVILTLKAIVALMTLSVRLTRAAIRYCRSRKRIAPVK